MKLVLSLLLIAAGAFSGLYSAQRLTKRRELLRSFSSVLSRAAVLIEYNGSDLFEVFTDAQKERVFNASEPFDEQWHAYIHTFAPYLKKDDISVLSDFGNGLGTTDSASQQKHIALYRNLLDQQAAAAEEDIRKKAKLYRIAPFSLSVIIALLLI